MTTKQNRIRNLKKYKIVSTNPVKMRFSYTDKIDSTSFIV